jgi:hypothetical protein
LSNFVKPCDCIAMACLTLTLRCALAGTLTDWISGAWGSRQTRSCFVQVMQNDPM